MSSTPTGRSGDVPEESKQDSDGTSQIEVDTIEGLLVFMSQLGDILEEWQRASIRMQTRLRHLYKSLERVKSEGESDLHNGED
jgi:spore cortex formation protein SpoVR/YcgB (stage V sporulation)